MPVLIIGIIIFLCIPKHPRKRAKAQRRQSIPVYHVPMQPNTPTVYTQAPPVLSVSDTIKLQREQDRQKRERERQKETERLRKEAERQRKEQAERLAANDKVEWLLYMIDKYSALYDQIENELSSNPNLTEYKKIQLNKQLLTIEEKRRRFEDQLSKQYFILNNSRIEAEIEPCTDDNALRKISTIKH